MVSIMLPLTVGLPKYIQFIIMYATKHILLLRYMGFNFALHMSCKQSECAKNKTQNYRRLLEILVPQRHTANEF